MIHANDNSIDRLTAEAIQRLLVKARMSSIAPLTVTDRRAAKAMKKDDPLHYNWRVGDKYYLVNTAKRFVPLKACE